MRWALSRVTFSQIKILNLILFCLKSCILLKIIIDYTYKNLHDYKNILLTSALLQRGEFRTAAEDLHTHRFQNPWMPVIPRTPRRPMSALDNIHHR